MKVFGYFRSSAAYRLRIAMNLKGVVPSSATSLHLARGEQRNADYLALNPQGLVPALVTDHGRLLTQSLAIIDWLDEMYPSPTLLPDDPLERARVRAIALAIACDIHPLNNTRVLSYLTATLGLSEAQRNGWYRYWIDVGFEALEKQLSRERQTGRFCHGDAPSLADVCLVPQVANARRYKIDLTPYPTIVRIDAACNELPAFAEAAPARQPDAE
ncbi:MAG TPA: maleylacetoacetate isomerase [Casimicrobiaceae bacterium]|nr:maleylacetoacetate isomerase [Casimicrobiaceae bacterium]